MKKRTLFITVLSVVVLLGLALLAGLLINKYRPEASEKEPKITKSEPKAPVEDHILVKFKDNISNDEKDKIHQKTGGKVKEEIKQIGVQIVQIPQGKGITPEAFIETYKGNFKNQIEYAEVDNYVEPALRPNDEWYTNWQLDLQWLDSESAWTVTTGSPSVYVAVLDTGVSFTHEDLRGRMVAGWDFVDNDADPSDVHGHGTTVTGVLGADTNNGIGIAGVSWANPVLVVRIGDALGYATTSRIAQGITYAADHGARAINVSYAGPAYSSSEAGAVDYAWNRGATVVASAGNEGTATPQYPAALQRVIAVSGVRGDDTLVYYSNHGMWTDVCAPCGSLTTDFSGRYENWGGTSISAPFVTGLFGLVFSANPSLTPQQAVDIVTQNTKDLGDPGFDQYYGWGKIDMAKAVNAAKNGSLPTPSPSPTPTSTPTPTPTSTPTPVPTGNITGKVSSSTGSSLAQAIVSVSQSGTLIKSTTTLSDGTYTLSNLNAGSYDLTASISGYTSQTKTGISVLAGQTTSGVNFSLTPSSQQYGSATGVVTNSSGVVQSGITVTASIGRTKYTTVTNASGVYTFTNLPTGSYTIKATAKGLTGSGTVTIQAGQIATLNLILKKGK